EFQDKFEDEFLSDTNKPDPGKWSSPPSWQLEKGFGDASKYGALRVAGGAGFVRLPDSAMALFDFGAKLQLTVREGQRSATWLARGFNNTDACRFTLSFPIKPGAEIRLQCGGTSVAPVGAPSPEWHDVMPLAGTDVIDIDM